MASAHLLAEVVSGNYFQLLGVKAALGRTLLPEDDIDRGGHAVIMLGFGYWRQAFGGSVEAVGRRDADRRPLVSSRRRRASRLSGIDQGTDAGVLRARRRWSKS